MPDVPPGPTEEPTDDAAPVEAGDGAPEEAAGPPDALTGAPPDADEIRAADPDREGDAADPYELRSGVEDSPAEDDPGSMLNR